MKHAQTSPWTRIVEPDPAYAGRRDQLVEEPAEVARLDHRPDRRGEYQAGIRHCGPSTRASAAWRARWARSTLTDRVGSGTVRRDRPVLGLP